MYDIYSIKSADIAFFHCHCIRFTLSNELSNTLSNFISLLKHIKFWPKLAMQVPERRCSFFSSSIVFVYILRFTFEN